MIFPTTAHIVKPPHSQECYDFITQSALIQSASLKLIRLFKKGSFFYTIFFLLSIHSAFCNVINKLIHSFFLWGWLTRKKRRLLHSEIFLRHVGKRNIFSFFPSNIILRSGRWKNLIGVWGESTINSDDELAPRSQTRLLSIISFPLQSHAYIKSMKYWYFSYSLLVFSGGGECRSWTKIDPQNGNKNSSSCYIFCELMNSFWRRFMLKISIFSKNIH